MSDRIPFQDIANFEQEVVLDNINIILSLKWNSRGRFWVLTFYNVDRTPIILSLKIVLNYELIQQYPDRGLPPGQLYAIAEDGTTNKIEQSDFINGRCKLVYVQESELASL